MTTIYLYHHFGRITLFSNGLVVAVASLVGVALGIWLKDHVTSKNHKMALLVLYVFALGMLMKKMWF